ncbi:MAG: VOC family protein [Candidatus Heimdallarchaeota archaeon]|nr:VOC family protein [Candidatus Heimdallarchaeota archaeon]
MARIADIFLPCQDVTAMREFYSNCIGFTEESFADEEQFGYLTYKLGDQFLVIFRDVQSKMIDGWSTVPTAKGDHSFTSWTIRTENQEEFDRVVANLQKHGYQAKQIEPQLKGTYYSYTVKDPMGNTLDVYFDTK